MAYNDMLAHLFAAATNVLRYPGADGAGRALGVGAHDFRIAWSVLDRYGIAPDITREALRAHESADPGSATASGRALTRKFFAHFGYGEYRDLDIYGRADIVWDLSTPIPESMDEQFDLVFDPTSNYVVNVNQAYTNTSRMVRSGGVKVVLSVLGDQTNRFDLNPSPNYLADFHVSNGFHLERMFLLDRAGHVVPYVRYAAKGTPVPMLLPRRFFWTYLAKQALTGLFMEVGAPAVANGAAAPAPRPAPAKALPATRRLARRLPPGVRDVLRRALRDFGRARERAIHRLRPDWIAVLILRKARHVTTPTLHITSAYRHLYEAAEQRG